MQPPPTPAHDNEDPLDVLARSVPRHVWLSLAIVAATVLIGLFTFDPQRAPVAVETGDDPAAQVQTLEGRVVAIVAEEEPTGADWPGLIQTVRVEITRGEQRGRAIEIRYGEGEIIGPESRARVGDRVLIEYSSGTEGERFFISDFVRWPVLLLLALIFGVAVMIVGGLVGVRALISMGFSVLIIGVFIVRGILAGHDPLAVAIIGALALLTASVYLTYGWRLKTHAAILGLAAGLLLTGALSVLFVQWLRLTGLGTEAALFLRFGEGLNLDLRGVLLAGIIIGTLGVLDDVTTNQAAVVFELKAAAPGLTRGELFRRSMVVGRDHIAAIVNTLLLAYAGASLTLLLLMAAQSASLAQTLNRSFMVEEITRTLVGSLGLVLATPITSLIAAALAARASASETPAADQHT